MKPYVPLGILYLTSHLRSKGFDVEVFDTTFSSREELYGLLNSMPPAVLGVYANLMTRRSAVEILQAAKRSGWETVVGGPEPAAYISEYLAAGADVVVIGEGEKALEELLPALRAKSPRALERVCGIAFRGEGGAIRQTPPRPLIGDLDALPWPARESVSIERYLEVWRQHHGAGSVSLITARGCAYKCRWCSHAVYGNTHRRRKPDSVVNEVEWILKRYEPEMVWMADDVFTIHHDWLFRYAAEMKRRGLKIPFECITRADRLSPQVADTLAELDCFRVWIGSESGSQRLLDAMERGVTVGEVQNAVALCKTRGIETGMFLMWGYEGEAVEDIEATVAHVKRSDPDIFLTTVAYPIKGTPYFDEVADRTVSALPWKQTSDRDFRLRGRHSRRFYQFADLLLRSEVELARAARLNGHDESALMDELKKNIASARDGLRESFAEVEA
ncbi:MAG: B12-binding domain-containing radical SAM protein [Acidobacteria bacterium]|nr:B12-binding domain-containing radical SAM protein [Acidobacteriota bacterium]